MVLVDSSVWIEYLSHYTSKVTSKLEELIRPANRVAIAGIIYQEVLQGIRNQHSIYLTQKLLERFPCLIPTLRTHLRAAEIFRDLALRGKTPSSIDTIIAALAMENNVQLFTLDRDFRRIETHSNLKLF